MTVRGATVLITGASRGMGRLFALRAAREGASRLVLWGRDTAALANVAAHVAEVARDAQHDPPETHRTAVDLAEPEEIDDAVGTLLADDVLPDVLVNNAGVITSNALAWELDPDDAARTVGVNTLAPLRLTTRLLPAMIADAARPKRILNVASAAGVVPNPRMAAYAASKAAFLHWSNTVRVELAHAGHGHIGVTTYNPSYVDTGMFTGVSSVRFTPLLTPERAVDVGWRAMLAGRAEVVAPASVHLARVARTILPTRAFDALAGTLGVYSSMESFRGRS